MSCLNQLHEVFKEPLVIDGELAVGVDDAVVLHLAVAAHTQGVVAGEVGALSNQIQARFMRGKQQLGLISRYLPMKPSGRRRTREVTEHSKEKKQPQENRTNNTIKMRHKYPDNNENDHVYILEIK